MNALLTGVDGKCIGCYEYFYNPTQRKDFRDKKLCDLGAFALGFSFRNSRSGLKTYWDDRLVYVSFIIRYETFGYS